MNWRMNWQNLLTICRKAGKMQMGLEPAKDAVARKEAAGILLMEDASASTKKEARFFSEKGGIPVREIPFTKADMGRIIGRASGVLAICDAGFYKKMQQMPIADADSQTEKE